MSCLYHIHTHAHTHTSLITKIKIKLWTDRAWDMAQWIRFLLCKCEGPPEDPQKAQRNQVQRCMHL